MTPSLWDDDRAREQVMQETGLTSEALTLPVDAAAVILASAAARSCAGVWLLRAFCCFSMCLDMESAEPGGRDVDLDAPWPSRL